MIIELRTGMLPGYALVVGRTAYSLPPLAGLDDAAVDAAIRARRVVGAIWAAATNEERAAALASRP